MPWRLIEIGLTRLGVRDDHGYIAFMDIGHPAKYGACPDREAKARFIGHANPAAVLALIAENEQLAKTADCWDRLNVQNKALSDSFRAERDQLKAELATERQRRWDGNESAALERDEDVRKLRAEIAGLKTGYEAYERVNAELKAENERLNDEYDKAWRHDLNGKKNVQVLAAEVARLSAENEALRKALRPLLAHWDDLKAGESLNVDAARAAMGKGEQP